MPRRAVEYVQCEQHVPVTEEITDAEIIQTATNGGDGGTFRQQRTTLWDANIC